jgi:pimeloyl-ACP methyl ester carboxylesterase
MSVLLALVLTYTSATVAAYFGQGYLQYRPTYEDSEGLGRGVWQPWRDEKGDFLGYIKPSFEPKKVVVFFHGMGGEALNWGWYSRIVPDDVVFVLAEYPGYGAKPGIPSQESLFRSSEVLLDQVLRRWNLPVTVAGESLGSAVACHVASVKPVQRLALVSPFTSVAEVAQGWVPFLPIGALIRDRFASDSMISRIKLPFYLIHGESDKVVPIALGKKLFALYPGVYKEFAELPGFDHYTINGAIVSSPLAAGYREFIGG